MTGVTTEHVLFFLYGTGANGKGIFLRTLAAIWGDYAVTASMDVFTEGKYERHPTELARLRGARLVIAQETEKGRHWNESRLKALTGGDKITARFMRQDFFEFTPQFKLMIAGNHKPSLKTVDEANRRRIQMIPFTVTIPEAERDLNLFNKLKPEWPGILRWALNGCLEWQRLGLAPPPVVRDTPTNISRPRISSANGSTNAASLARASSSPKKRSSKTGRHGLRPAVIMRGRNAS